MAASASAFCKLPVCSCRIIITATAGADIGKACADYRRQLVNVLFRLHGRVGQDGASHFCAFKRAAQVEGVTSPPVHPYNTTGGTCPVRRIRKHYAMVRGPKTNALRWRCLGVHGKATQSIGDTPSCNCAYWTHVPSDLCALQPCTCMHADRCIAPAPFLRLHKACSDCATMIITAHVQRPLPAPHVGPRGQPPRGPRSSAADRLLPLIDTCRAPRCGATICVVGTAVLRTESGTHSEL